MPILYMFPRFGKFLNGVTELAFGSERHFDVELCNDDCSVEDEVYADAEDLLEQHCEAASASDDRTDSERQEQLFAVALAQSQTVDSGNADTSVVIFKQLEDVIAFCKNNKSASPRWKQVADTKEAENFSSQLSETFSRSDLNENSVVPVKTSKEAVAWRMPQSQETVKLRKCIEAGSVNDVRAILSSNPRYLIGSGDTPTVLQEGCRYNAFHIAAKADRADILSHLLATLRSKEFFNKMYPEDTDETTGNRMAFLIDLYLNMPDKTRKSETPLHFACKFGALECVRLLLDQPECDRSVKNGDGLEAHEIICERVSGQPVLAKKINALFEERFVIPIVRDEDGDCLPRVGAPVTPRQLDSVVFTTTSSLNSPARSRKRLSAVVGPLSSPVVSEVMADLTRLRKQELRVRLSDAEKGLESIARQVARHHGVPWTERWEFLDRSVDLSSAEGLEAFENYLRKRFDEAADVTFIMGKFPTKTDYHVWHALEPIIEGIDVTQLPFIGRWIVRMRSFTKDDMMSWRTPVKSRPMFKERGAGDDVACLANLMERFSTNDH